MSERTTHVCNLCGHEQVVVYNSGKMWAGPATVQLRVAGDMHYQSYTITDVVGSHVCDECLGLFERMLQETVNLALGTAKQRRTSGATS